MINKSGNKPVFYIVGGVFRLDLYSLIFILKCDLIKNMAFGKNFFSLCVKVRKVLRMFVWQNYFLLIFFVKY